VTGAILIVAVSARMLAELAVRAGHEVVALDRFGDLDLQRLCPSVSLLRDLGGRGGMAALVDAAEEIPAPSVVYGAGLENRPALVARLAAGRKLLGCPPETLERVRDPFMLGASLDAAGLAHPRTYRAADAPRRSGRSGRWLRKPLRSGGGRGVREWRGGALRGEVIVQEQVAGLPCSAVAVADGRSAVVLGIAEQLIGHRGFGARRFAWCGNVVPPRLGETQRRALAVAAQTICSHLARGFGLRGLFGVDLVWDGARAWVIEVNPRPTGSLECIEAAHGVDVFAAHLEGCAGRLPAASPAAGPRLAAGKAIVFATHDVRLGDTRRWPERGIRDVPHPGERIAARRPVCTLVAEGPSPHAVLAGLERRAAALRAGLARREEIPTGTPEA
jgi:predicted ATP-grasp superfamily ATP-dependent carboligase